MKFNYKYYNHGEIVYLIMRTNNNNHKKKKTYELKSNQMDSQNNSIQQQNYEVQSILSKRIKDGEELYRVKWKGYDERDSTWQPKRNLDNCSTLILQFQLKKLSQQKWEELKKEIQESEDSQFRQQFSQRIPHNLYDHNVEAVSQKSSAQIYKERVKRLQILMKNGVDQPKDGSEIDYIIGPVMKDEIQDEVPTEFRICLKTGQCCIMSKKKLYTEVFRHVLLRYYESLIEFKD